MRQLFVLDPLGQINPAKDSSVALMQAAHRAGDEVWACTPSDLIARGDEPLAIALPVTPEPWITVGVAERQALAGFDVIWMRKDPPVDEAYLYATHLLEVAERAGVRVLNRPVQSDRRACRPKPHRRRDGRPASAQQRNPWLD